MHRRRSIHHLPDVFFQRDHYSSTPEANPAPVDLHAFGNYRDLTPEIVDPVIETEIQRFMTKFNAEEEIFVDQSLRENPVKWYYKPSTAPTITSDPCCSKSLRMQPPEQDSGCTECTRCKMLNKIKKAKFKLRYKFMTMKLEQNASTLQSLRNFIDSAEGKLRIKGRSEADLKELRHVMGIDRFRVENLADINRQFFKIAEKAPE